MRHFQVCVICIKMTPEADRETTFGCTWWYGQGEGGLSEAALPLKWAKAVGKVSCFILKEWH